MKDTVFRLLVHFLIAGLSLAAPANPPNGLNLFSDDSDGPFQINTNSTNTLGTNVRISYSIPSSKLSLLLVYMDVKPIERKALGYTLQRAQQSRRAYLATHPDTYLDPAQYDDPFRADYLRTGKCALRIQSVHVGGPGKQRMTYGGVLDVLRGLWDVLFMGEREFESVFEVRNGSLLVGWGTVLVGNMPSVARS